MHNISVVGLGKLGSCTAVCFASAGYKVLGLDINKEFVNNINQGKAPVQEPNLNELLTSCSSLISATHDPARIIQETDVTFLIVPTPSLPSGNYSNEYMHAAIEGLALEFKKVNKYHLFVVTSTVDPYACTNLFIPLIEKISNKKCGRDFDVCYNPEFIALGSVIKDFLNPDLLLIGQSSEKAGNILVDIYKNTCRNQPQFCQMSLVSAEITKISLNSYITMKISYANTLARICEQMPGSNIDDVTKALGADKRIGPYYLKGGLSYGGPCFPRDNRAFAYFASKSNVDAKLAKATDELNEAHIEHLHNRVLQMLSSNKISSVGILGLAYKPCTPVIEESPAIKLIQIFLNSNLKVNVFDSLAMDNTRNLFKTKINYSDSIESLVKNVDALIITTPDNEFKKVGILIAGLKRNLVVLDCWRTLEKFEFPSNITYLAIGLPKKKVKFNPLDRSSTIAFN